MLFLFLPDWLTATNFLIGVFMFLILIVGAFIVLIVRGRSEVSTLQSDRATAAEALVKTRDAEIVELKKSNAELEEELESVTAEHRTLVGVSIAALMEFWLIKEDIEARNRDLERDLRVEKKRKDGDCP